MLRRLYAYDLELCIPDHRKAGLEPPNSVLILLMNVRGASGSQEKDSLICFPETKSQSEYAETPNLQWYLVIRV